jgi:uncharacterized membrane protein YphA (DoxX/SURF4 family)
MHGNLQEQSSALTYELNLDGLIGVSKNLTTDLSLDAIVGGNIRKNQYEYNRVAGSNFVLPYLYTLSNVLNVNTNPADNYKFWKTEVHSAYYSVDLSYKHFLTLRIPSAFTNPELLRSPWWIRTFETLGLAGAAVMVAGLASVPIRESWIRTGRIALGISLPVFGVLHFVYPASVAALVALSPVGYPWPMFWAYLTGTGHFLAGVAIASGVLARPAAVLAGFMYGSWALTLHLPRIVDHPATYSGNRGELTSLSVCVAFWGSAWLVAGAMEALPADRRKARASPDG